MDDKRQRIRQHMLAEVKIKPSGNELWIQAVLTNINQGGIGVYAMGSLTENENVAIRISYLDDGKVTEVEEVPGCVRWVQMIGESTAAGIGFDSEVNQEQYPILHNCLAQATDD